MKKSEAVKVPSMIVHSVRVLMAARSKGRLRGSGLKCRTVRPGVYRFTPTSGVLAAADVAQIFLGAKYEQETCLVLDRAGDDEACRLTRGPRYRIYVRSVDPDKNYLEVRIFRHPLVKSLKGAMRAMLEPCYAHADFHLMISQILRAPSR